MNTRKLRVGRRLDRAIALTETIPRARPGSRSLFSHDNPRFDVARFQNRIISLVTRYQREEEA